MFFIFSFHFYDYVTPPSKHSYHITQFELLDTLDKGIQQSLRTKLFLTSNFLLCGIGLFGITILAAQFPQVYSPKVLGISRKLFLNHSSQYVPIIFVERLLYMNVSNVKKGNYYLEVSIMDNYYFNLVSQYEISIYQPETQFER